MNAADKQNNSRISKQLPEYEWLQPTTAPTMTCQVFALKGRKQEPTAHEVLTGIHKQASEEVAPSNTGRETYGNAVFERKS